MLGGIRVEQSVLARGERLGAGQATKVRSGLVEGRKTHGAEGPRGRENRGTSQGRERALSVLGERLTGTVLTITAAETRSQRRNRAAARERLGEILRAALTPPIPRRATKPTRASKLRRLDAKKRRSEVKARRRRPNAD